MLFYVSGLGGMDGVGGLGLGRRSAVLPRTAAIRMEKKRAAGSRAPPAQRARDTMVTVEIQYANTGSLLCLFHARQQDTWDEQLLHFTGHGAGAGSSRPRRPTLIASRLDHACLQWASGAHQGRPRPSFCQEMPRLVRGKCS